MRITCPTCAAAYEVPAERLAVGRTVRCARCGSGWAPVAEEAPPEPLPPVPVTLPDPPVPEPPGIAAPKPPDPPLPAVPAPVAVTSRRGQRLPVLLAWAASLVLLAASAWAMAAWRADIMRAWPPSERLYAALGLLRR